MTNPANPHGKDKDKDKDEKDKEKEQEHQHRIGESKPIGPPGKSGASEFEHASKPNKPDKEEGKPGAETGGLGASKSDMGAAEAEIGIDEEGPGVTGEVGSMLKDVRKQSNDLYDRIAEMHDRLLHDRGEQVTPDYGDITLEKERAGVIATQGQLDILSLIKSKLEQVVGLAKGITRPSKSEDMTKSEKEFKAPEPMVAVDKVKDTKEEGKPSEE